MENKSIQEIKQAIVDSLRNIEYDVMMNDFGEVESKLSTAQKYYEAWMAKATWTKLFE